MLFQTFMSVSFLGPSKNVNILDSKKLLYPTSSSYHHFIPQFSILFYHPLHFLIGQTTSMEQLYPGQFLPAQHSYYSMPERITKKNSHHELVPVIY